MDNIYLILVVVLFALAFSDLIVGVSNDAVNFLNSAIGSKVAPRYVILTLASIGIIFGATFSSGMMEVARKGIFHPDHFYFAEIMTIFLAVMIADVILLDLFNTFGLPTSTTVSIVFELLGAAVAISLVKIYDNGGDLGDYINSTKALVIMSGILLSIVVAFTVGTIVQYLTRTIFTFNYEKYLPYFGSAWGATSITAITYFILIKGAKGSSVISPESIEFIIDNTIYILLICFVCWLILLQFILWFTKLNILKLIILVGTFALAMAFASNDLVNFIGVPLAGFASYMAFVSESGADATKFLMTALEGKVETEGYLLVIAGIVMVVTLWFSKKARSVSETEINLSRQDEGYERFGSSKFSRNLVRGSIITSNTVRSIVPGALLRHLAKRFKSKEVEKDPELETPSFDLLRASVNLTVASVIISFATSLKLPLSTTYVTFMVSMGSSFGDGAWGRESAVYRVTGVTSVIGGWFLTAFAAFTAAMTFAFAIHFGGILAIGILVLIALIFVLKTHSIHRNKVLKRRRGIIRARSLRQNDVLQTSTESILETLSAVAENYTETIYGLATEDRKKLKKLKKAAGSLNKNVKHLKDNIYNTINSLREDFIETGHYHVQVLDYLKEMGNCLTFISSPIFEHIDNNHKGMSAEQIEELFQIRSGIYDLFKEILESIKNQKYDNLDLIAEMQSNLLISINEIKRKQVKRIHHGESGTKNSLLFLGILSETKNLLLHSMNLIKAQRDFIVLRKIL